MKNYILLLLVGVIMTSCGTKIDSDYHQYKEGVQFQVKRSSAMPITAAGLNSTAIDVGGTRFVTLNILFKNSSETTQEIDFNEIYLLDDSGRRHDVTKAAKNFGVVDFDNFEFTLKSGRERLFIVTFEGFPRGQRVRQFDMEGNIVTIQ